jgi:hypothetical protein
VLNTPDSLPAALGPERFWEQVNKPFLDAAIARGDDIVLATRPTPSSLNVVRPDGAVVRSGFGKEYDYLRSLGFSYDETTGKMVRASR